MVYTTVTRVCPPSMKILSWRKFLLWSTPSSFPTFSPLINIRNSPSPLSMIIGKGIKKSITERNVLARPQLQRVVWPGTDGDEPLDRLVFRRPARRHDVSTTTTTALGERPTRYITTLDPAKQVDEKPLFTGLEFLVTVTNRRSPKQKVLGSNGWTVRVSL